MLDQLIKIISIFEENKINYCLIDGLAMLLHHGRANTVDIDFYVLVDDLKKVSKILDEAAIKNDVKGSEQIKVKLSGTYIDILKVDPWVGESVIARAITMDLENSSVKVATVEDLIVIKTIAGRSIDQRDVEELRELYAKQIDEKYIQKMLSKIDLS